MLVAFDELADRARIWIYQAERKLSEQEQHEILRSSKAFIAEWAAHGQDLKASAAIEYDQFLIIAADENFNSASGCSIDSSVHFVQGIARKHQIDFFDRMKLGFLLKDEVKLISINNIKDHIGSGDIDSDSLFFQNTITTKGQLDSEWLVKAGESWLKRYFKVQESV